MIKFDEILILPQNFRLKRLQVMDLVLNKGIFSKLNFSIPTDDFLDVINEFDKEFLRGRKILTFSFLDDPYHYMSELLSPQGLCFTFNIALSQDLLKINSTSDDFHYKIFWTGLGYPSKTTIPRSDSQYPYGLKIQTILEEKILKIAERNIDGYQVYLHDPYELPSSSSVKYIAKMDRKLDIKILPQINSIDDSIVDFSPKE
jgi:hypothetical protein